jgi:dipeptidase E
MLTVDERLDATTVKRAFESDVIYLAGGNTFYFLLHLRQSGLISKLKQFAKSGGVLAGLSAGALIMTPSIGLAGYPAWEADENDVGLRDLRALGLVGFEFFPHFERTPRMIRALARYSRAHSNSILTAEDGGGIVVNEKRTTLLGRVSLVTGGEFHEIV